MPFPIKTILAREILDSRGNPTVSVTVTLKNGITGTASVPSGASTGSHEALELRDGDPKRYGGQGVLKAIKNVNTKIAPHLKGMDALKQRAIDEAMLALDGTENKTKLGANAILGVSLAVAHAAATASKKPLYVYLRKTFRIKETKYILPLPMMNIINGGRHADNSLSMQECMIIPRAKKFSERVRMGAEVFHTLKKILKDAHQVPLVGDEGGYAPQIDVFATKENPVEEEDELALGLIVQAITAAGYTPGKDISLGVDVAASEFFEEGKGYDFDFKQKSKGTRIRSFEQTAALYTSWMKKYPLISIEDPFAEDQWDEWQTFTAKQGKNVQIVGDDFFVTNTKRLQKGIDLACANAILIKLNQIGTLTETIDCIALAKRHNYKVIISHRSGETADTTIADLAVAVNAEYIKTGSLSRSERVEKYNRLMAIEAEL